jgi:prolactin regulatory element-binding protein
LVVGGGGGAGRSGVKNKISLFDFTSRAPNVEPIAEIDCGDTDSVNGLANLAIKDGLILYTGINDSEETRLKGTNEHFRSFEVQFPKSKAEKLDGSISFLSKTSLFTPPQSTSGKKEG